MVLYQCDICGGICLEEQIILLTINTEKDVFLSDLCPSCFQDKFSKAKLRKLVEEGEDDEKNLRH